MLLTHAEIWPMEGENIPDGYLLIEKGKITAVGPMAELPENLAGTGKDLSGKRIMPGFIDAHCHLGMWEDGLGFEGDDGNESTDPVTPQLRAIDALNPLDHTFEEAYRGGVTTVLTGPGSANPIGGQWTAIKTKGRRIDDMTLKPVVGMKFALGENPKTVYNEKSQAPMTRMATAALIRETLKKTRRYMEDLERAKTDEDFDEPDYDSKLEALIPVLKGEIKAFFHAHRADDIFTAIRIGKEFNLDLVICHCTEGHLISDLLAGEKIKVIAGPTLSDRSKPELRNLSVGGISVLNRAGLRPALCTDHPVTPIQYLPLCAGISVGAGLAYEEGLRAITLYAAEAAGIQDRVGSLRPGKDADFIIFEGDPLSPYFHPEAVCIDGEFCF